MARNTTPHEADDNGGNGGAGNDLGFHSIRDRYPVKRNPIHHREPAKASPDRSLLLRGRSHHSRFNRKGLLLLKGKSAFYSVVIFAVFLFAMASMVLQSSITLVFRQGGDRGRSLREGLRFGSTLKFVPARVSWRDGLDSLRSEPRIGVRAPRLALVSSVLNFGFHLYLNFLRLFLLFDSIRTLFPSLELLNFIYVSAISVIRFFKLLYQWR
jgi:hypothetical protein